MLLARTARFVGLAAVLLSARVRADSPNVFTNAETAAIQPFLENCIADAKSIVVVGLVDEQGSKVFAAGTLDNSTDRRPDGDTVFFIGSVTKTFTDLLLLNMVDRGEVKLDDPVTKYLPATVKLPTHGGKEITLFDLATHTAGLPLNPDNMTGADGKEKYESYTIEKLYAFLAGYALPRDPGAEYEYSNAGFALLGHALSLRAGVSYESLVVDRICRPLHMESTCITPTPELKERLAMGHDDAGNAEPPWRLDAYIPAGSVHSTANDLLKYAAAQAGLTKSSLTPQMEQSHQFFFQDVHGLPSQGAYGLMGRTAMDWVDRGAAQPPGMQLLSHAGGAGSYHSWVGFDKLQKRGVVVLTTDNKISSEAIGYTILQRLPLTEDRKNAFAREMVGVGVALEVAPDLGTLRITKVLPGTPAADAGLTAGQFIQMIDDDFTIGKSLDECVKLLRGPVGAKVRLKILDPEGKKPTSTVELTRQKFST